MYRLKEEQGRKVYLESIKSLQAQTFWPQHKSCLLQAEMLPSRCTAVLWKTWLHSHSGLFLTDLWKSPVAARPVVHRSVFNYLQSARYCGDRASERLQPPILHPTLSTDSRGAQESGAVLAEFVETAWAPGPIASFPVQRQANNQTWCPLMRVWAGI